MKTSLVILLAVIALCQATKYLGPKPGNCPRPSGKFGICSVNPETACQDDNWCPEELKCCSEQCGRVCKKPVYTDQTPTPDTPLSVPGECPPPSGQFGICTFDPDLNCIGDAQCAPDYKKCCPNGCGRVCMSPVQVQPLYNNKPVGPKPGACPKPSGKFGICSVNPETACQDDNSCPEELKCCSEQCGRVCKKPVYTDSVPAPVAVPAVQSVPGECPPPTAQFGICTFDPDLNCIGDAQCAPAYKKCCPNGCGRVCLSPIQVQPVKY